MALTDPAYRPRYGAKKACITYVNMKDRGQLLAEFWDIMQARYPDVIGVRGDRVVHADRYSVRELDPRGLQVLAAQALELLYSGRKHTKGPVPPSNAFCREMLTGAAEMVAGGVLPKLTRVVATPFFSSNGELHERPGIETASGILFRDLAGHFREGLPEVDDGDMVELQDRLKELPFRSEDDVSNALGLLLLAVVRPLIGGPVPLHVVHGRDCPSLSRENAARAFNTVFCVGNEKRLLSSWSHETERQLHAALEANQPLVRWDDVKPEALQLSRLVQVVRCDGAYTFRPLKSRTEIEIVPSSVYVAVASELDVSFEMAGCCVQVELAGEIPRNHPTLLWLQQKRSKVIASLVDAVVGWEHLGAFEPGRALPGFEDWSHVVGGVLSFLGWPFLSEHHQPQPRILSDLEALLPLWPRTEEDALRPLQPTAILALAERHALEGILDAATGGNRRAQATRLGLALAKLSRGIRRPTFGGHQLEKRTLNGVTVYRPTPERAVSARTKGAML